MRKCVCERSYWNPRCVAIRTCNALANLFGTLGYKLDLGKWPSEDFGEDVKPLS